MEENEKRKGKEKGQTTSSIVLYVIAAIVAASGIALLIINIVMFKRTIAQYVAQGYTAASVSKELVPSQLVPQILNVIGLYGGISAVLFAAGIINNKVSKYLNSLKKDEVDSEEDSDSDEIDVFGESKETEDEKTTEETKTEEDSEAVKDNE